MHELSPAVQSWVHHDRHEVVLGRYFIEKLLEKRITFSPQIWGLFFESRLILALRLVEVFRLAIVHLALELPVLLLDEVNEGVEERLVAVGAGVEADGTSILDQLK